MLTRLILVLPMILILCGFERYPDDAAPPELESVADGWTEQELERLEAEKKQKEAALKERKEFRHYAENNAQCGFSSTPFRIAALKNSPPFFWEKTEKVMRDDRQFIEHSNRGMLIALSTKILETFGSPLFKVIYFDDYKSIEKALQQGQVDIAPGIPYNLDESLNIDYIFPAFLANPLVAVMTSKEDVDKVKVFGDLKGYKGVVLAKAEALESTVLNFTTADKEIDIIEINLDAFSAYNYLLYGHFAYILTSQYAAKTYQRGFSLGSDIFLTPPIRIQQLFMAFSKNTDCRTYRKYFDEYLKHADIRKELSELLNQSVQLWHDENKQMLPYKKDKMPQKKVEEAKTDAEETKAIEALPSIAPVLNSEEGWDTSIGGN